ncbi:Isotrichodermin C-15 hydroxylase [Zalerion maritima]|uniref:Isotrichodermin C-15 hydroxylase n=1 Tax=Zalerion maritima TaxID=339359 RepID=A0AAD5WXX1_9PEZI|nr:Isotrichodermin C-15 hydroxylase [Zalerion maritima]
MLFNVAPPDRKWKAQATPELNTGKMICSLYFHPFLKYPGPFLAKTTRFYSAYHARKGDVHLDMWRCHERGTKRHLPASRSLHQTDSLQPPSSSLIALLAHSRIAAEKRTSDAVALSPKVFPANASGATSRASWSRWRNFAIFSEEDLDQRKWRKNMDPWAWPASATASRSTSWPTSYSEAKDPETGDAFTLSGIAAENTSSVVASFSVGTRSCLKKPPAMAELQLVLASVLYKFGFELAAGKLGKVRGGNPKWKYVRHRSGNGPFLLFTPRE